VAGGLPQGCLSLSSGLLSSKRTTYSGKRGENRRIIERFYTYRSAATNTGCTEDSMTSDDSDTADGADEDTASEASSDRGTAGGQPRDPETGKFLPKDERPGAEPDEPEASDSEPPSESAESEPREAESQSASTESAAPVEADAPEPKPPANSAHPSEPQPDTGSARPTGESPTPHRTDAATWHRTPRGSTESTVQAPRTVFVPNPNGYPRPPAVYLPALPWLRVPSRPPAHETV
jgi:hypothetical protein